MSLGIKDPNADFSNGPGRSTSPFVAPADLLLGYDFSNQPTATPTAWKTGLVSGQTATAKVHDYTAHTTTASDAGWSVSPNGRGIRLAATGMLDLGYSMPKFANNDGVGKTFMVLAGLTDFTTTKTAAFLSAGWLFNAWGVALAVATTSAPNQETGAAIGQSSLNNIIAMIEGADPAWVTFLTADGAGNWVLEIPTYAQTKSITGASIGVSDPMPMNVVSANPGLVTVGLPLNTSVIASRQFDIYAAAIWNRKLTAAEKALQYERLRFRYRVG